MEKMKQEDIPPPPPPPPPPDAMAAAAKFVAPVVVDSTKEVVQLASTDDIIASSGSDIPPTEIVVEEKKDLVIVEEEKVFLAVEENATFQGGDLNVFRTWVQEHMKYPESAAEMGLEGKVTVKFVVNPRGGIEGVQVMRGVDPALDQEAIRAIMTSPKWIPGKQGGKAVKQQFVIPINFKLQK